MNNHELFWQTFFVITIANCGIFTVVQMIYDFLNYKTNYYILEKKINQRKNVEVEKSNFDH